jgi:phospholipid/cholesterol/gamma-HCH transport system substrate-binding protein
VELSGATRASPLLRATGPDQYPLIRTKPSLSARLENVLTAVLIKLDRTTSNIDALLSNENRAAVSHALADLAALSHTLAERRGTLDAAIINGAATLAQTRQASSGLTPLMDRLGHSADSVTRLGDTATLASARAADVAQQLGQTLRHANADTLPQLQGLMAELDALSVSLRQLSDQTVRSPSGLLLGRSPVPLGPGELPTGAGAPAP